MNTPALPSLASNSRFASGPGGCPVLAGPAASAIPRARFHLPEYVLALLAGATMLAASAARATNTQDNVVNSSTDLTVAASYQGGLPTASSDVTFTNVAYSPAAFTLNSSLGIGTLNDLSPTALTIQNTSGTADTLTLSTAANSVSGTAADLLYVAASGNLSLGGGAGNAALNLNLAVTGNLDIAGTATISSPITAATTATFTKTGAGTLTFAGNGSSTFGASTTGGVMLSLASGTTNFGIAGTDAPSFTISGSGSGVGVYLTGGNFNMVNGTITETESQGLVISGSQTYTQTGGTFSTGGLIEFANLGGSSVVNISGGTLTDTNSRIELAIRGNSTTTLSGTGAINTPLLVMTTTQLSGGAAGSTFNLNGGTLTTGQIVPGTNGTTGTGTIFSFNGGTLTSSAASTTFLTGLTTANVRNGGAIINTGSFADTIGQALVHSTIGGDNATDGGLTKQGSGTLTLTGANTYNGPTTISAGTLQVGNTTALGTSAGAVSVTSGAVLDLFGTTITNTNALTLNGTGITSGGALVNSSATGASYAGPITLGTGTATAVGAVSTSGVSLVANSGALITTGAITTTSNGADDTLTLGGTGTGGNDVQSTLSDAGSNGYGLIINKTGTGTWALGGSGTSSLARGNIVVSAGTLNFGSATEAPTLSLATVSASSPNGAQFYLSGGTFNMVNGTLTENTTTSGAYGLYVVNNTAAINVSGGTLTSNAVNGAFILAGNNTYTQTGGTVNANLGRTALTNGGTGNVQTLNISGGNFNATTANGIESVRGTATINLSGTGTITTPLLNLTTNQVGNGNAVNTTVNLGNGTVGQGTLVVGQIIDGDNGETTGGAVVGNQTFSFNGGILQASASTANFMPTGTGTAGTYTAGNEVVQVRNGGAIINTAGFNDTIAQPLLHSTVGGDNATDGGLTKQGLGTLTLTGASTYTGPTSVNAGTLLVSNTTGSGTGSGGVTVASGGTLGGTGMLTNTAGVAVNSGGTITTASGALTLNSTLTLAGQLQIAVSGATSTALIVNGAVTLSGSPTLGLTATLNGTSNYDLVNYSGTETGQFSGTIPSGYTVNYSGHNFDTTPGSADIELDMIPVPEPSTWAAGLLCFGMLGFKLRRRLPALAGIRLRSGKEG